MADDFDSEQRRRALEDALEEIRSLPPISIEQFKLDTIFDEGGKNTMTITVKTTGPDAAELARRWHLLIISHVAGKLGGTNGNAAHLVPEVA